MEKNFKPGDVEIVKLMLHSDDGQRSYDLSHQAQFIDIYESVTSPIIYGEINIQDSNDLLRQFPILTEEYIELSYKLPGYEYVTEFKLHVKEIVGLNIHPQQKTKSYTLTLCSMEMVENAKSRVDKNIGGSQSSSSVQQGVEIDKAVEAIVTESLKSKKKFNAEPTKGIDQVLITRVQPFRAIDGLRRRAVSKKYQSSAYCFFENQKGYWFTTLEKLFVDGRDKIGDKIFFTDTVASKDVAQNQFRNIIGYKQLHFADSINKINSGGFRNNVGYFDLVTGDYRVVEYKDDVAQDNFQATDGGSTIGQNTSKYTKEHTNKTAKTLLVPHDSSRPESDIAEKLSLLQAYTYKLTHNIIHIYTWGDNNITAGNIIECHLPAATGTTDANKTEDRLSSGKFLVAKVRHIIQLGSKPMYNLSMELIKSGMFEGS